jgi:hypothetical protein
MIIKFFVTFFLCLLAEGGYASSPSIIDLKIERVLEENSYQAEKLWNAYIKQFKEKNTLPPQIRLFDPAQGRSDCEEQATIFMNLLLQKKYFKELDIETQQYLTLRLIFIPTRFFDPFGMVVSISSESKILQALDKGVVQALRQKISTYVDKKIMNLAHNMLPKEVVNDTAFEHTPVGKKGLTRISTTAGCMVMLAFAKKYDIPIIFRIKRMKPENGGLKGIAEHFIAFRYDLATKVFKPYDLLDSELEKPAFFIRAFSISGDTFNNQWLQFSSVRSENDYIQAIKSFDLEKLIWLIASGDDYSKKRDLQTSKILKPRLDLLKDVPADVDYTFFKDNKEFYTCALTPMAIRHIYLSTLKEQKDDSDRNEFSKIYTADYVSFEPDVRIF